MAKYVVPKFPPPKPLGAYLARDYKFSTQADTVEAMQMGKELFAAGRLSGLEEAAKIAERQIDIVLAGASVTVLSYEEVLRIVVTAIREMAQREK